MSEGKYCDEIFLFQKTLKKLRDVDDKIIYALNLSTPTKSFQERGADPAVRCSDLQQELAESHQARGRLVHSCIDIIKEQVRTMNDNNEDKAKVRAKQNILRGLESEVIIEDIIRERTNRAFKEKCSEYL